MIAFFGGLLSILAVVVLGFTTCLFIRQQMFMLRARRATGEVVRIKRRTGENGWLYHAVIAFETDTGRSVTFDDAMETNWARFTLGQTVSVLYDPERPGTARVHSFATTWLSTLVSGGLGLLLLAGAAMLGLLYVLLNLVQ